MLSERLGYGAEGRRKVSGSNPGRAFQRQENPCQPSSKWEPVSVRSKKTRL